MRKFYQNFRTAPSYIMHSVLEQRKQWQKQYISVGKTDLFYNSMGLCGNFTKKVKFPHSPILHYAFSSGTEETMTKTIQYISVGKTDMFYNSMGLCGNFTKILPSTVLCLSKSALALLWYHVAWKKKLLLFAWQLGFKVNHDEENNLKTVVFFVHHTIVVLKHLRE